jgi:hypothetical protein
MVQRDSGCSGGCPRTQSQFLWSVGKPGRGGRILRSAPRHGVDQPSSLGLLHSRGRLGVERINELLAGAPYVVRQDHSQRGLLLDVPASDSAERVLSVMCTITGALCDYESTGDWRLALYMLN